jgi:hypothetical protein
MQLPGGIMKGESLVRVLEDPPRMQVLPDAGEARVAQLNAAIGRQMRASACTTTETDRFDVRGTQVVGIWQNRNGPHATGPISRSRSAGTPC